MEPQNAAGFATSTPTDHRAWLWVVGLLACVYSILTFAARLMGKWDLLGHDDIVLGVGYVFAILHWGVLYESLTLGLGASTLIITPQALREASKLYFSGRILLIIALYFSKLSVISFARRIFSGNIYREKTVFGIALGSVAALGVMSCLLVFAGCDPENSLVPHANAFCHGSLGRTAGVTTADILTEALIIAIPSYFISKNTISSSKKRLVIFVFSFRLLVVIMTIVVATTQSSFYSGHGQTSIGLAPTVASQEVLLGFSLISASIPCIRSFLWAFMSRGLITMYGETTAAASQTGTSAIRSGSSGLGFRSLNLRPKVDYRVDVQSTQPKKKEGAKTAEWQSVKSYGSEQMIIRRNVEVDVDIEPAEPQEITTARQHN